MKKLSLIFALIATFLFAPSLSAQSSIDKAIDAVEKDKTTQYCIFSEKRNPTTQKVYKSSKVLVVKSQAQVDKLVKAFNHDRGQTVNYEMLPGRMYVASFQNKSEKREYILRRQADGSWLLTVEIVNADNAKRVSGRRVSDPDYHEAVSLFFI